MPPPGPASKPPGPGLFLEATHNIDILKANPAQGSSLNSR